MEEPFVDVEIYIYTHIHTVYIKDDLATHNVFFFSLMGLFLFYSPSI